MEVKHGYDCLADALTEALERAQTSKGKDRHAPSGEIFKDQIIFWIERLGLGFQRGQSVKKLVESVVLENRGDKEGALAECLDSIVYICSHVIVLKEEMERDAQKKKISPEIIDLIPHLPPIDMGESAKILLDSLEGNENTLFLEALRDECIRRLMANKKWVKEALKELKKK
jgi:hypothetical protein